MVKIKNSSVFICNECGNEFSAWQGKCEMCGAWDSLKEVNFSQNISSQKKGQKFISKVENLSSAKKGSDTRYQTNLREIDLVLGGGIVAGSIILLGGEPGVGKSTLLLEIAEKIDNSIYVSAEESREQVALRSRRIKKGQKIKFLASQSLEQILHTIASEKPRLIIIDSIQTIESEDIVASAGSVAQVKYAGIQLQRIAKEKNVSIIIVGHITKQGQIAGPKILEHLVDAVIYLEGEKLGNLRLIRATKNRFGAVNEVGVLEMTADGLKAVDSPSELFLAERKNASGSVVACTMEGLRPILVEVQALTNKSEYGFAKRVAIGFDANRLDLICAIIQNKLKLNLQHTDIFLNIAGGMKVKEVGIDTAVAIAIISSHKNQIINPKTCFWGELGLTGEIRKVSFHEKRLKETKTLGFNYQSAKGLTDLVVAIMGLKNK